MVNFFTTFYHFPTKYSPEQNSRRRSFVSYTESRIFCLSATLFLEFWKRHRASFVCEWKVSDWCEEEVKPLLNYFNPTLQHRIGIYCRIHIMWFISFLNLCDRRNSSWRLWIMKTVNPENISTPICAARWFWSASQSWWVVVSDVLTKSLNIMRTTWWNALCSFTDSGDHWPDTRLGGVQSHRCRALSWGIMGVPEQPLEQWSHDAGSRPSLSHHHCHDTGTPLSQCSRASSQRESVFDANLVFFIAGKPDCCHEAVWNRFVHMFLFHVWKQWNLKGTRS